jgi:hypothetical protein
MLLVVVCGLVLLLALAIYRRDGRDLPRGVAWLLLVLRVTALVGLLIFFLDLEKRIERKLVKNSRVVVLVDTSQSMGLTDADSTSVPAAPRRIDLVTAALSEGPLLARLGEKHDVVVYRFDQTATPSEVASLPKLTASAIGAAEQWPSAAQEQALGALRRLLVVAAMILAVALLAVAVHVLWGRRVRNPAGQSWALLIAGLAVVVALVLVAVGNLRYPEIGWRVALGRSPLPAARAGTPAGPATSDASATVDWAGQLTPRGAETRLGDALRDVVEKERGGPIAGILLLTDGQRNAGSAGRAAAQTAAEARIPVFPVGLGLDRRPVNIRVADLEAPARVYPGDRFTLTGFLQAFGLQGRSVKVNLFSHAGGPGDASKTESFEEQQVIQLGSSSELIPVRFEIAPNEPGRVTYTLRVEPLARDHDARDNQKSAGVEVVERKNRVLLLAGGPTREYQFVRNLLFRDRDTRVDVLLQSATPGISQEADEILQEFPAEPDALFAYDAIVAFDPDWSRLTDAEAVLLDRWVAEKAGGLVVVAGPVHTARWAESPRSGPVVETVKALYPVVFYGRGSVGQGLRDAEARQPWPLEFSEEGRQAEFLWLDETAAASERAWAGFEGVYSYYPVKAAKPGARVFARFSDPQAQLDGEAPIYMAGHFYGAGRVFFLGSGEMWRLRGADETHLELFYTKLIRYVSQGRLLRDSSRGVLLVDVDRCLLGDSVAVRAVLTDAQHRPLNAPEVQATLVQPDSIRQTLTLRKMQEAARDGMYAGQFMALLEGDYRLELPVPDSENEELLTREVRVRVPDREVQTPERNDALLSEIASVTGGVYYVGLEAALGRAGVPPVAGRLLAKDQETYLPGTPDKDFERRLMTWLLILMCGALSAEWLLRRLNKLA